MPKMVNVKRFTYTGDNDGGRETSEVAKALRAAMPEGKSIRWKDYAVRALAFALRMDYDAVVTTHLNPTNVLKGTSTTLITEALVAKNNWTEVKVLATARSTGKTARFTPDAFDPTNEYMVVINGGKHVTYVGEGHVLRDNFNCSGSGLKPIVRYWSRDPETVNQFWDRVDKVTTPGSLAARYFDNAPPPRCQYQKPEQHIQALAAMYKARDKALSRGESTIAAEVEAIGAYTGHFGATPGPRWLESVRRGYWVEYTTLASYPIPDTKSWDFVTAWKSTGRPLSEYIPHNGVDLLPAHIRADIPLTT